MMRRASMEEVPTCISMRPSEEKNTRNLRLIFNVIEAQSRSDDKAQMKHALLALTLEQDRCERRNGRIAPGRLSSGTQIVAGLQTSACRR
jgi:hypothetical protein